MPKNDRRQKETKRAYAETRFVQGTVEEDDVTSSSDPHPRPAGDNAQAQNDKS